MVGSGGGPSELPFIKEKKEEIIMKTKTDTDDVQKLIQAVVLKTGMTPEQVMKDYMAKTLKGEKYSVTRTRTEVIEEVLSVEELLGHKVSSVVSDVKAQVAEVETEVKSKKEAKEEAKVPKSESERSRLIRLSIESTTSEYDKESTTKNHHTLDSQRAVVYLVKRKDSRLDSLTAIAKRLNINVAAVRRAVIADSLGIQTQEAIDKFTEIYTRIKNTLKTDYKGANVFSQGKEYANKLKAIFEADTPADVRLELAREAGILPYAWPKTLNG